MPPRLGFSAVPEITPHTDTYPAKLGEALAVVGERLRNMEESSRERAEGTRRIEGKLDAQAELLQNQQVQLTQLSADVGSLRVSHSEMAKTVEKVRVNEQDITILKTKHESFWKATTILASILAVLGGAMGWAISTVLNLLSHAGVH